MTPEGRIKKEVKKILDRYAPALWYNMPVPTGYGKPMLDFVGCYRGLHFKIETKAPGETLTPRQEQCRDDTRDAGGKVFVIDGEEGYRELAAWLQRP